tara:strand:- start:302 stop:841 length:540 start_codon:yes stop_codon:yes gene_type:complete
LVLGAKLNLEKNFESGDTISSNTFNEILSTLQKINTLPKDEDLLGNWICSAKGQGYNFGLATGTWKTKGSPPFSVSTINDIVVKFTSSGTLPSEDQPYFFEQSSPIIIYATYAAPGDPKSDLNGEYVLRDGKLILKSKFSTYTFNPEQYTSERYTLSVESNDRIILDNDSRSVICDKQS